MDDNMYLISLLEAVRFVYCNSGNYFSKSSGRERSMVFRIAHRLANVIEGEGIFVDIEATRCNYDTKRIGYKRIIPDLIVHKRFGQNILVAEFKCDKNNWDNDFEKLSNLTQYPRQNENKSRNMPYYKLGIFVYLGDYLKDVHVIIYKNGKNVTDNYVFQNILKEQL